MKQQPKQKQFKNRELSIEKLKKDYEKHLQRLEKK
jgi:hypothetical protein